MKRILVTASHHKMADGLKDTLNFVSGGVQETIALSAYLDCEWYEPSTCISGSHGAAGRIYHGGTDA